MIARCKASDRSIIAIKTCTLYALIIEIRGKRKKSHIPGVTENIIIVGRVTAQTYRRLKSALSGGEIARTTSS